MSENDNDFVMAFQDSCDKPALLLIHGFPLSSSMWTPQIEDLGDYARVIAPDLRGFGNTDSVPGPYSITQLADDCADLLGHLNVATPFVVCGLSMGGYIALEFYRRYPEHVSGLILAATRAGADSPEGKAGRDKAAELAKNEGATAVSAGMLPKMMAAKTYENDPELVGFAQEIMSSASLNGVVGALAAMRDRIDSTPTLGDIDVPVLIIHGADDTLIPPTEAEAMHKAIPNSELVLVPDAGHLPNLEQPDIFNDAVIDFLEDLFGDVDEE
ncbi:alpha/beta fold hydrolase [Candidatus Leptofilum sp.]|uniref:alpha/beta fold hydrolase n=1 Tax=Candidatus Leptofilum sp. TaxID=3241576 RepID=UPI003B59E2DA